MFGRYLTAPVYGRFSVLGPRLLVIYAAFLVLLSCFYFLPNLSRFFGFQKINGHRPAFPNTVSILVYTKLFGQSFGFIRTPDLYYEACPEQRGYCTATEDRALLDGADALLFHWRDVSPLTVPNRTASNWHQYWVLLTHESPYFPGSRDSRLGDVFNLSITYRLRPTSDVYLPYFYAFPNQETTASSSLKVRPRFDNIQLTGKSGWIAWAASNCDTPGRREQLVHALREYLPLDVYGACGSGHLTASCNKSSSRTCERPLFGRYRFYLSFENSLCKDYVTEKIGRLFYDQWNTIPVVYGLANYSNLLPPNSFIDVRNFSSISHLAQFLRRVGSDQALYDSYFKSRSEFHYSDSLTFHLCALCRGVRSFGERKVRKTLSLSDFFIISKDCLTPDHFLPFTF